MSNYVKTPVFFQNEACECGAATLASILYFFGRYTPLEQIREDIGVSRDGCSAGSIMRTAKNYKLNCHGYRKETEDLKTINTPCIIHWEFNHFVVFEGFKGQNAYINDPALGRRKMSFKEIDNSFTGIVLTFSTNTEFKKIKKPYTFFKFAKKQLHTNSEPIAKLFILNAYLAFSGLALPLLSRVFIDDVLVKKSYEVFSWAAFIIISCVVLQFILNIYQTSLLAKLRKKLVLLSTEKFLTRLFSLPLSFFEYRFAGDLAQRVKNIQYACSFVSDETAHIFFDCIIAIFYFLIMLFLCPVLSLTALVSTFINILIIKSSSRILSEKSIRAQKDTEILLGVLYSGINSIKSVKTSGRESELTKKLLGYTAKIHQSRQKLTNTQNLIDTLTEFNKNIFDVIVLTAGGIIVINGKMSIGTLAAFGILFTLFNQPIIRLISVFQKTQTVKSDINRTDDIMNHKADNNKACLSENNSVKTLNGYVELNQVSFGYKKNSPAIVENISINIECGSSVAIVGKSGCGKSTILKLISGLYTPWNGKIKYDNINIKSLSKETKSVSVSVVSQNPYIYSGTIKENIKKFNEKISETDMIRAAKDACIHDEILNKRGGYNYVLRENASNLSGGQRQRLEIARALATNPAVLIMDEATSSIDADTEKEIINNIKRRGCTLISAAHRLSAVQNSDKILVISEGKIVGEGTHSGLLKNNEYYQKLMKQ